MSHKWVACKSYSGTEFIGGSSRLAFSRWCPLLERGSASVSDSDSTMRNGKHLILRDISQRILKLMSLCYSDWPAMDKRLGRFVVCSCFLRPVAVSSSELESTTSGKQSIMSDLTHSLQIFIYWTTTVFNTVFSQVTWKWISTFRLAWLIAFTCRRIRFFVRNEIWKCTTDMSDFLLCSSWRHLQLLISSHLCKVIEIETK